MRRCAMPTLISWIMGSRFCALPITFNQRSFYFADPDGNTLEIYYELPHALELFPEGRADQDEALKVSGPGEPLPGWLLEDWPSPEMQARIAELQRRRERTPA